MFGDFGDGAVQGAAAGFDELFRGTAHALHFLRVFEEMNHFDAGIFGTFDLDGGLGFDEARGHGGEIFHRRAEDGDLAEGGRFENVVAAGIDEGAADKDAVGEAIEGGEFADGVEEEDGGVVRDGVFGAVGCGCGVGIGKSEFGAADEFAMGFLDEFGGRGEALGLAGSEDQQGLWEIALDDAEGDEGERLFGGDDTSGDDERTAVAALAFLFQPLREGSGSGKLLIVFEIAADRDAAGRSAKGFDAVGVLLGLHQKGGGVGERGLQERLEVEAKGSQVALPAGERAVRDASADEENGNFALGGFAEEIGPDFGFEDDDESGLRGVKHAADAEDPVEREVDEGVGEGHTFSGEGVAGLRGRGDDEGSLGIGVFEAAGESNAGKGFPDGYGVNPDSARAVGGKFFELRERKTEALAEIGEIFVVAKSLDEPVGRGEQGGEAHQETVNEIHSM